MVEYVCGAQLPVHGLGQKRGCSESTSRKQSRLFLCRMHSPGVSIIFLVGGPECAVTGVGGVEEPAHVPAADVPEPLAAELG
jgi:hypothetical protein